MKKDLRVIKTKALLQEAMLQLLKEKSLDKINISELCKLAQVSRGTFYMHYQDILELFGEYFDNVTKELRLAFYEPYILTGYKIENIDSNMVQIFYHVKKHKNFYKIVLDPKTPLNHYYQFFDLIRILLKESTEQDLNEDLDFILSSQANAIIGFIIKWIETDFDKTPHNLNELLISNLKFK